MSQVAMQMALWALENVDEMVLEGGDVIFVRDEIAALREALAQPEREPIARVAGYYGGRCVIEPLNPAVVLPENMALYASPAAQPPAIGGYVSQAHFDRAFPVQPAQPEQEPVATLLLQSKQNFERNFGPHWQADWVYSDLAELLEDHIPDAGKMVTALQAIADGSVTEGKSKSHAETVLAYQSLARDALDRSAEVGKTSNRSLTDERIAEIYASTGGLDFYLNFARAIEAAHGIKEQT